VPDQGCDGTDNALTPVSGCVPSEGTDLRTELPDLMPFGRVACASQSGVRRPGPAMMGDGPAS